MTLMDSPPSVTPGLADKDVRTWSMLCHLAALLGLVVPSVGSVIGPLVVWLVKRNDHPTIDAHGKESLNFQLSILIYSWVLGVIGFIGTLFIVGLPILLLAFLVGIAGLAFSVYAAIKASNGEAYRYPCTIRFFA